MTSLRQAAGRVITYSRGAESVEITAVAAFSRFSRMNDAGMTIEDVIDDWLIDPADLVLGGVAVEPAEGDRIIAVSPSATQGDITLTYKVLPPSPGESAWRYSDPARQRMRVHTKIISREPPA
jgi:hypothetical protein